EKLADLNLPAGVLRRHAGHERLPDAHARLEDAGPAERCRIDGDAPQPAEAALGVQTARLDRSGRAHAGVDQPGAPLQPRDVDAEPRRVGRQSVRAVLCPGVHALQDRLHAVTAGTRISPTPPPDRSPTCLT